MRYLSSAFTALLSLVVLPSVGLAKAPIVVSSITAQCPGPTITITVTSQTAGAWLPGGLFVHYDPSPSAPPPGTLGTAWGLSAEGWSSGGNPGVDNLAAAAANPNNFIVPTPGVHTLQITAYASSTVWGAASAISSFNVPTCAPVKMGMTWVHSASNAQTGTVTVGCGSGGPNPCNSYTGDTVCTQARPLLCIYKPATPFPLPVGVNNANQYIKWSGGIVATTAPVPGTQFAHLSDANAYCKAAFGSTSGTDWRVAEFHDGWGWYFQAYGGTVSAPAVPSTRFWVHINDQPANCWLP